MSLFTGHNGPHCRLESNDHADLFSHASHVVPREKEVVGVSHFRLAIVDVQLIGSKHVLARRPWIGRLSPLFIERIDDQIPIDLHRSVAFILIEHQAAAKAASWRLALRVTDRVDPDGDHT